MNGTWDNIFFDHNIGFNDQMSNSFLSNSESNVAL